jgi:hypothetical protein
MAQSAKPSESGLRTSGTIANFRLNSNKTFQSEGRDHVLKLFTAHNSICTQKVFLTLLEKGLPWNSEYIDLFNNEQYRPDYLRLNPKGVVPTLIHEGRAIIESTLI